MAGNEGSIFIIIWPMRFEFVVRSGKEVGRTVALSTGQAIALGRLKGCEVVVDDEAASRRHCTITARDGVCVVADLQSANGTFVNEHRIATTELQKGDKIRIGSTVIELMGTNVDQTAHGPHSTTSLSIVESRSNTLVQRAVDPTKLEFLSQVYKRKDENVLLQSAQRYLSTLHKVSDILSRASSVEALFDSILSAILEVSGGDRAAILMRPPGGTGNQVDMVAVCTREEDKSSGQVMLSRTVVNDVLEKGISAYTDDALADERYVGGESIVQDGYTHKHSERVAAFGVRLAQQLGFDADGRAVVELSGLLHDVGKIGVPDAILNKPGKLTDSEFSEMRMHPLHGARILSNIQSQKVVDLLPGVKYHHERWDGKGYPEGLKGEEIPLLGRLLGVADFLDALTSDRSYRKGLPLEEAVQMVRDLEGKAFDPVVVKAAVELHAQGQLALPTQPNPETKSGKGMIGARPPFSPFGT